MSSLLIIDVLRRVMEPWGGPLAKAVSSEVQVLSAEWPGRGRFRLHPKCKPQDKWLELVNSVTCLCDRESELFGMKGFKGNQRGWFI